MYRRKNLPLLAPAIRTPRYYWKNDGVRVFKGVINGVGLSIVVYGVIAALFWTVIYFHLIHIHL